MGTRVSSACTTPNECLFTTRSRGRFTRVSYRKLWTKDKMVIRIEGRRAGYWKNVNRSRDVTRDATVISNYFTCTALHAGEWAERRFRLIKRSNRNQITARTAAFSLPACDEDDQRSHAGHQIYQRDELPWFCVPIKNNGMRWPVEVLRSRAPSIPHSAARSSRG